MFDKNLIESQPPTFIKALGRVQLVECVSQYFDIRELVCRHIYERFGEKSWQFIAREQLENILAVRAFILKKPMVCNTWASNGLYDERGYRCNICEMVKDKTSKDECYMSAHCSGQGNDFIVKDMLAEDARALIKKKQHFLPNNMRMEKDVSWLHMDCYDMRVKVYEFQG